MFENDLLTMVPLPRIKGASGTKTRKYLQLGMVDEFVNEMPEPLQSVGKDIFELLGGKEI